MSENVNLEMTYTTYSNLCDAVEQAATHTKDFDELHMLVHLYDFLEDEYNRDCGRRNLDYKTWLLHEDLFRNKKLHHHQYFYNVKEVLDEYEEKGLLEIKISEQNKFHLICELIDVFKENSE